MVDTRFSERPAATTPLDGTELVEAVQGGVSVQVEPAEVGLGGTLDGLTDVDTSTTPPTDQQALLWDDASSLWVPGDVAAGGGGGGLTFTGARLVGAATTLTAGALTTLNWSTTPTFDTNGFFNPATPTRLTIPAGMAGYYEITTLGSVAGIAQDKRWLLIVTKNGATTLSLCDLTVAQTFDTRNNVSTGPVYLNAGDYITVGMYQFDTVNRATIHADNFFSLRKVG